VGVGVVVGGVGGGGGGVGGRGRGSGSWVGVGVEVRALVLLRGLFHRSRDGGRSRTADERRIGGKARSSNWRLRVGPVRRALAVGRTSGAKVGAISMSFVLHRTRCIDAADREALSSLAKVAGMLGSPCELPPRSHRLRGNGEMGSKSRPTAPTRRHVVRGGHAQAGRRDAPNSQFFVASRYTGSRTRFRRHGFTSRANATRAIVRSAVLGRSHMS